MASAGKAVPMEFQKLSVPVKNAESEIASKMNAWPDCYYRERDPNIRKLLLDEAVRMKLTPEENEMRSFLYEKRYSRDLVRNTSVDNFMKTWIDFRFIKESLNSFFSKKANEKKVLQDYKRMGFEEIKKFGESSDKILYDEIYHLGMLYISLCEEDKGYKSLIFGLGQISDSHLISKIAGEFRTVAFDVPRGTGLAAEYSVWTDALRDAFCDTFPDNRQYLEDKKKTV